MTLDLFLAIMWQLLLFGGHVLALLLAATFTIAGCWWACVLNGWLLRTVGTFLLTRDVERIFKLINRIGDGE